VDDRGSVAPARLFLLLIIAVGVCSLSGRAASRAAPETHAVIGQVGERVAGYHRRAQSIVCLETSTVQPIRTTWAWDGMARTVVSELRVEPDATVRREVRRINGREPRERDKKDRAGCTDPNPLSPEPLAFLLPEHREEYDFTAVRDGRERNRAALVIDFTSANPKSRAELIEDERGHDDCFDWSGPIATRGQVWVDAATYDVLRVERHNSGPVDLRISWALQRRYLLDSHVTLDRDDLTLRYKDVTFSDPAEVVVLPDSIESMTIVRSSLQSTRRTTTFSDYRRFLTAGRVRLP
jgi:hypothetical protein